MVGGVWGGGGVGVIMMMMVMMRGAFLRDGWVGQGLGDGPFEDRGERVRERARYVMPK